MAIYVVVMEQGISFPDLGAHTLMTGHGEMEDAIQSCSAVILVNPGTGAAGLYHFPAGNIDENAQAQDVLRRMHAAVASTECHVVYGTTLGGTTDEMLNLGGLVASQPGDQYHDRLIAHLRGLTGLTPTATPASAARHASVRIDHGAAVIELGYPSGDTTDLRNQAEGTYQGGQIYWSNRAAPKKTAKKQFKCIIL